MTQKVKLPQTLHSESVKNTNDISCLHNCGYVCIEVVHQITAIPPHQKRMYMVLRYRSLPTEQPCGTVCNRLLSFLYIANINCCYLNHQSRDSPAHDTGQPKTGKHTVRRVGKPKPNPTKTTSSREQNRDIDRVGQKLETTTTTRKKEDDSHRR